MNDWFFYQEQGQTVGPFTLEDLRVRIRDGRLKVHDLLYRDGEEGWQIAFQHPAVQPEFHVDLDVAMRGRPWVCLHRKSEDGFDFVTTGPFAENDVREALREGRLNYGDYAWAHGMPEWTQISHLERFNPRLVDGAASEATKTLTASTSRTQPLENEPPPLGAAAPSLANIVELKRRDQKPKPPLPPEAAGEDLTKLGRPGHDFDPDRTRVDAPQIPKPTPFTFNKSGVASSSPPIAVSDAAAELVIPPPAKFPRRRLDLALMGGVLAVVGGAITWYAGQNGGPRTQAPTAAAVTEPGPLAAAPAAPAATTSGEAPSEALVKVAPAPVVTTPTPPAPPAAKAKPVPPTQVQARAKEIAGGVHLTIHTDASAEFPLGVQIVGTAGQFVGGASSYAYRAFNSPGRLSEALPDTDFKLAPGRYTARIESGGVKRDLDVNVATGEGVNVSAIARARKANAAAIFRERLSIYKMSLRIEAALTDGKLKGGAFDSLNEVRRERGANYVFFLDWLELKEIVRAAREHDGPTPVARAKRLREKYAAFSVWSKG